MGPVDSGRGLGPQSTIDQQHGGDATSLELGRAAGSRAWGLSWGHGEREEAEEVLTDEENGRGRDRYSRTATDGARWQDGK
jgi:hypothetical protein